jgi:hypothetical protein
MKEKLKPIKSFILRGSADVHLLILQESLQVLPKSFVNLSEHINRTHL